MAGPNGHARTLDWAEAHHAVVPLMRPDNLTNIPYILREYAYLAAVISGCVWSYRAWASGGIPTAVFVPLATLGALLVAIAQHRLSGLAHDASHYVLFRNKVANELVSDIFLMFPIVAMTQKYRESHLGHHQFVNDPARDPDLIRLNRPVARVFPMSWPEFWLHYVAEGLWPPTILRYLFGRAKAANLASDAARTRPLRHLYRNRVARSLRGAYWLSLLSTVHLLNAWPIFWLFWVVPLLTFYPFLMQLREIAHHANTPDDGDLTNSRVFEVNPLLAAAVFPYGQAFHLTHHLFAMVPHHRIAEVHDLLRSYPPYRDHVQVCRGYFFRRRGTRGPSLLEVLSNPARPALTPRPVSAVPAPRFSKIRRGMRAR